MSAIATSNIENSSEAFTGDPRQEDNQILTELNDVELVMSLSSKSVESNSISEGHQQQILKQTSAALSSHIDKVATVAIAHQQYSISNLEHLQNLHNQHNSQSSYFHNHSTPFSVTDILSPIEESYRKLEISGNPPSPYR
ncbi:hypothetical protein FF38_00715 [Lucilia cuprina]|uniref:Uncharacterized protein n=1 Tax=Lucilia cuprina TaxID=7375 RepID=A0A0L0BWZ0_LUCCU|nr:hypothetical protein CVS40_11488 [Lucilia cuprina]KNC24530.1 hypothetical protein FF38_00715 [Lucilia cuprina]